VILLCLAFWYIKSQTLWNVRFILPRFWSTNPYPIPQTAKEDKPFLYCGFKKSDKTKKERKNLKDFMPAKTVYLNHTKTELGSTKLFY
jgi:hypothetical protein